jgi:hypothetical protein
MSTLYWAGIGIDPDTQSRGDVDHLNDLIDGMLRERDVDTRPDVTILESDGSRRVKYQFGRFLVTDLYDRLGNRIGFGIEAVDEKDAERHVVEMQTLCNRFGVDAWISIWSWSRSAVPCNAPVETFA